MLDLKRKAVEERDKSPETKQERTEKELPNSKTVQGQVSPYDTRI